jgi:hypothetical protein
MSGRLALTCEIYPAFRFAQARARDRWQRPLPPHLVGEAGQAVPLA